MNDDSGRELAAAVNAIYRTNVLARYGEQADAQIIEQNETATHAKTAQLVAETVAMGIERARIAAIARHARLLYVFFPEI